MNKDRNNSVKEYMSRKEPFYNWIIRAVIAIALVAVIIAGSVTVMGKINADRRLYDELVGANKDRIFEQNGGEGVKDNFFEAESALFEGTVSDGENDYGTSAAYSCVVDAGFGGGVALRGIGTSETADKPNTLTFGFVSDKKVRITMTARVNAADVETPFSEIYTVTVNGKSPRNIDDAVLPARSDASVTAVYGYAMADVDLVVDLSPGENTVVVRTAKNADCVIDYLNLKTSAALTGYVSRYRLDEVATIVSAPTDSGAGEITLTDEHYSATYVLPSVMDGLRKGVYTSATGSETVDVMLGASGFVLARSSAQPHTLTVESEYVTFGDSDSATVTVYGKMPQPDFSAPEGYEFYGWYEKDAAENLYGKDDFIMPGRDITLVPIFEDYDYAEIVSDELGKVRLLPESMSGISPIREDMGNGFVQRTLRDGISKDIMTTDGKGEVATVFNYGRVEKGWSFMTMNACDHMVSGTKSLVSYMQNKGNSPISFTVYQTSSSSAPTAGGNPCKTVELAPGESERFIFTFTFRNNNLLSYFEFNAAADELKLACVQYIVTGTYRFPGESAETYTATLKGDALFAESGLASAQVPAGEQLPEVALTGASAGGDRRIVGYIADDGDTETFVFAESFVMPSYDVTLTPYVVLDWDYYTSGGDGVLDFSEEGSETVNVNGNVQEFGMAMISPYNVDSVSRTGRYVLDKGEVGTEYTFTGDAGEYFRLMRAYVADGTPRTVTYKFRNTGSSDISFTAYQVNSGTDTSGAPSDKVTIAPGEETTISLEFAYTNKNIMCLIVLDEAATDAKLWMSAEITSVAAGDKYTVNLTGDATFADGTQQAKVSAGAKLPEVVLTGDAADKNLVGWLYGSGDETVYVGADSFLMPESDVTLTPYVVLDWDYYTSGGDGVLDFSEEGSETVNDNGNVQEFGMAMIDPYNVDSVSRTGRYVLDKGEVGTEYTFTGDAGEYFRLMRAYVVGGTPRTVTYKFRNTGTSDISFTAYQVNSGTDTNGAPSDKVTIAPGEETTISLEFAYTNKNIMCLIVLDEAATNAKLWMSAEISATE